MKTFENLKYLKAEELTRNDNGERFTVMHVGDPSRMRRTRSGLKAIVARLPVNLDLETAEFLVGEPCDGQIIMHPLENPRMYKAKGATEPVEMNELAIHIDPEEGKEHNDEIIDLALKSFMAASEPVGKQDAVTTK